MANSKASALPASTVQSVLLMHSTGPVTLSDYGLPTPPQTESQCLCELRAILQWASKYGHMTSVTEAVGIYPT